MKKEPSLSPFEKARTERVGLCPQQRVGAAGGGDLNFRLSDPRAHALKPCPCPCPTASKITNRRFYFFSSVSNLTTWLSI